MTVRLSVASRAAAAVIGGFTVANVSAVAFAYLLPIPLGDAVMAGILASFAVFAAAILWSFAARTAARAWAGLLMVLAASLLAIGAARLGAGV